MGAGRGFDAAGSGDEVLDIQVDEARQSGPLEFVDPQQAGIYVRDVFCSASGFASVRASWRGLLVIVVRSIL